MTNWSMYRLALHVLPKSGKISVPMKSDSLSRMTAQILRKHRCVGASLCTFDVNGPTDALTFGYSHLPDTLVSPEKNCFPPSGATITMRGIRTTST